jgi:hypothetical protein
MRKEWYYAPKWVTFVDDIPRAAVGKIAKSRTPHAPDRSTRDDR